MKAPAKKRKPLKLTREQRKAIWKPSDANAGAGWMPKYQITDPDPIAFETGNKDR